MKDLVFNGPGKIIYEDFPDPIIEEDRNLIIRVTKCSICGSDLHPYHGDKIGRTDYSKPIEKFCTGHEIIGEVMEVGKAVRNHKVGMQTIWAEHNQYADKNNEPGKFSAFIGWEWTSTLGGNNLHRILFTPDDASVTSNFLPYSATHSPNPEDLWTWLEETTKKHDVDLVSIPHNSVQNYVQDEVLYREALKLGLDQNDFVLKRRIIQKMEFILDDFEKATATIEADSLELFYEQNKERYFQAAQFSFTHIFFKNDGQENALNRANLFMGNKAHQKLSASESLKYGDRFLYHRNYAEKTSSFLESQFGTAFTQALSKLQPDETAWHGPIPSTHGQHWVQLSHKQEAKVPLLKDIKNVVKMDYLTHLKNQHKQKQIKKLVENYKVQVNWN